MPTAINFWFNLIGFQAAWWACALYGNTGAWLALAWLLVHFSMHRQRVTELRIVLACGAVGWLVDTTLSASGWLMLPDSPWVLPFWLVVLWGCFAATLNNSMQVLQQRWLLAVLLGATGGPLSYYAGTELGRLAFPSTLPTLLVLAAVWAVLLPGLLYLARILSSPNLTSKEIA
jgi:Protein of unknown function (DUF2878)